MSPVVASALLPNPVLQAQECCHRQHLPQVGHVASTRLLPLLEIFKGWGYILLRSAFHTWAPFHQASLGKIIALTSPCYLADWPPGSSSRAQAKGGGVPGARSQGPVWVA
jgi:hypothetical protein